MRSVVDRNVVMGHIPVCENSAVLVYYVACSSSYLPTFRTTYLVPIFTGQEIGFLAPWKMGLIGCTETSVKNCHCKLHNNTEERGSQGMV